MHRSLLVRHRVKNTGLILCVRCYRRWKQVALSSGTSVGVMLVRAVCVSNIVYETVWSWLVAAFLLLYCVLIPSPFADGLLSILANQHSQGPFSVYRVQYAHDNPLERKSNPAAPPLPLLPQDSDKQGKILLSRPVCIEANLLCAQKRPRAQHTVQHCRLCITSLSQDRSIPLRKWWLTATRIESANALLTKRSVLTNSRRLISSK